MLSKALDATSSSHTIAYPDGILAGDVVVLLDYVDKGTSGAQPSNVVPGGFTQIATYGQNGNYFFGHSAYRITASYRLAAGSLTGSLTGMGIGEGVVRKVMAVFRGSVAVTGVTVGSVQTSHDNFDPLPMTVASADGIAPLMVLGFGLGTVTMSPAKTGELDSASMAPEAYLAWKFYDEGSATADVSVDTDVRALIGCYLQLAH